MSVINTNVNAIIAQNAGVKNSRMQTQAMQQLSTGNRINSAADDAAGLAISSKMTAQIRGLNQAVRNANDGISLIQTAEGALTEVNNMLQRMRELAVQSASDTNTDSDRTALNAEFSALRDEINRIGNNTQFNGMNVLNGQFAGNSTNGVTDYGKFIFQVGANAAQTIDITLGDYRSTDGVSAAIDVSSSSAGAKQTNLITPTIGTAFVVGDLITFTKTDAATGVATTYDFTATAAYSADAAGVTALTADLAGDANFSSILGLTGTNSATGISFQSNTADTSYTLTMAVKAGSTGVLTQTNVASFSGAVQTDTLTMQDLAAGKSINIDLGGGRTYTYTNSTASTMTAATVAQNIAADATAETGLDVSTVTQGGAGNLDKLLLAGAVNTSFTTTATKENGPTGDLQMINSSDITTQANSNASVTAVDAAIAVVSGGRATMGATINRLNYAADNLLATSANVSASRSRIQDTDYSQATTELARTQIIQQASTAMLAQANQSAQSVLSLLK